MGQSRYRRRQKVVDASFQFQLGMHLIGWLYLYVVVVAVAVNLPALKALVFSDVSEAEYVEAILAVRSFSNFVLVPLIVTFLAMAGHAILLTHRIAGPMFRVKAVLRDMAQRHFAERVTFRTKDFLKDVAEEMTITNQALREDQARMLRMNEETKVAAQRLAELARAGADQEHLVKVAEEIIAAAAVLERHVASAALIDTETADRGADSAESAESAESADEDHGDTETVEAIDRVTALDV